MAYIAWSEQADEGLRLFNERRFFECHDVWEEIWMRKAGDERTFYQGLIQVAVGFYKIEVMNQSGARSLLRKGIAKLESVSHLDAPLDVLRLVEESRRVLERVEALGQSRLAELDPGLIPVIHARALPEE